MCDAPFTATRETMISCAGKCESRQKGMWQTYRLTPEAYRAFMAANPTCNLCGKRFLGTVRQCIDHDHDTGVIRGILCTSCNSGLGKHGDNSDGLEAAQRYLLSSRDLLGELLAA